MKLVHTAAAILAFATCATHLVTSSMQASRSSHLSTFRTENLKIRSPPKQFSSIIDEAIWLMRTHFLKRHLLTETDWEKLPREYMSFTNVNKVRKFTLSRICFLYEEADDIHQNIVAMLTIVSLLSIFIIIIGNGGFNGSL